MEANSEGGMSTERGRWGVIPTERGRQCLTLTGAASNVGDVVKVLERLRELAVNPP